MVHLYKSGRQYLFGIDICYTFYFLCCIIYHSMERMVLLLFKDAKLYMWKPEGFMENNDPSSKL